MSLVLCLSSLPAAADVLFSDLGAASPIYNCCTGWTVSGSGSPTGTTDVVANLFQVSGVGSLPVTQIDIAMAGANEPYTFNVSIFTDNGVSPGGVLMGWVGLSTSTVFPNCCDLVSIIGISGLSLTGGASYFLEVTSLNFGDTSSTVFDWNNQGVTGDVQLSSDNITWVDQGTNTLGAFDILNTPEPGSLLLFGTGLIGILGAYRRRARVR